jgi:hypothetical protein
MIVGVKYPQITHRNLSLSFEFLQLLKYKKNRDSGFAFNRETNI